MSSSNPSDALTELSGWGLYPRSRALVREPETLSALRSSLSRSGTIARGLGRSYGDPAMNDHRTVVRMTRFDRLLEFDAATGVVRCEAGVSLSSLIDTFAPRGWFPLITPGTRHVTVGGCIANDVHGKAHHAQGSFLESVRSLKLLVASGEVLELSRDSQPELFHACFGGMGLLGIIVEATLQLRRVETTWFRQRAFVAGSLEALLEVMAEQDEHFPYSVANIDPLATGRHLGRGVLTAGDHAALDDLPRKARARALHPGGAHLVDVPVELPSFTINPLTLHALHAVIKQVLARGAPCVHADQFFYPLDALGNWNRGYGPRGFTQYQFVIPRPDGAKRLREMLVAITEAGSLPALNVLKRLGPSNAAPLSFPMDGYTLAIDFPIRNGTRALTQRLDAMVLDAGGRIYLGKDAFLEPASFGRMYPRAQEFSALKARVDPRGIFQSDLSRRVGLT